MAGKIVHHDDIVWPQNRDHALFDISSEALAIHRSIEHTRCGDFTDTQGGNECRCLPMSPRHSGDEALTTRTTAIAARHVGCCTSFVNEDQAFRVQVGLARMPLLASLCDIWPILLGSPF